MQRKNKPINSSAKVTTDFSDISFQFNDYVLNIDTTSMFKSIDENANIHNTHKHFPSDFSDFAPRLYSCPNHHPEKKDITLLGLITRYRADDIDFKTYKTPSFLTMLTRAGLTSTTIASLVYPFNFWQTIKQTKLGESEKVSLSWKEHWGTYKNNNRASFMKNSIMANRSFFEYEVEKIFGESLPKYQITLLTGIGMGFIESCLTQYPANKSVLYTQGNNAKLLASKLSFEQTLRLAATGFELRNGKNIINAIFCVSTVTIFNNFYKQFFPNDKYGNTADIASTLTGSFFSSLLSNWLDVILKSKLKTLDPKTFKTKSSYQVAKLLYQNHGLPGFMSGVSYSFYITSLAYATINFIDSYMKNKELRVNIIDQNATDSVQIKKPDDVVLPSALPILPIQEDKKEKIKSDTSAIESMKFFGKEKEIPKSLPGESKRNESVKKI